MSFSILGTGHAVPDRVVTNDELSHMVDTNDEWISSRTGIRERRVMTTESLTDLSVAAAKNALENAGVTPQELDLIICATIQGDYLSPAEACLIQKELGASCPAFDVNGACSGFVYALDVADGYFARGRVKKVLVVASEALSRVTDWSDRRTCVLFGDGSGAVVLGEGDDLLSLRLTTTGNDQVLYVPAFRGKSPFDQTVKECGDYIYMNGQEVYRFAVNSMFRELKASIEEAGLTLDQIDYLLPHQANLRIIDTAVQKLKIPREKVGVTIQKYGNTSSSSVAILPDEMTREGKLHPGDILAIAAFGGGLTTGACVIRWSR